MSKLDDEARITVEANLDDAIRNPEVAERAFKLVLRKQGIEPTIETVLSYVVGNLHGLVYGFYIHKHGRILNDDENKDLADLLRRRAFELRDAFLRTRIEE